MGISVYCCWTHLIRGFVSFPSNLSKVFASCGNEIACACLICFILYYAYGVFVVWKNIKITDILLRNLTVNYSFLELRRGKKNSFKFVDWNIWNLSIIIPAHEHILVLWLPSLTEEFLPEYWYPKRRKMLKNFSQY